MKRLNITFLIYRTWCLAVLLIFGTSIVHARENNGTKPADPKKTENPVDIYKKGAGCAPATAQRELNVNNVRTTILNGGDMWWNLSSARYEIPKVQTGQVPKHSLFAGALWIGGVTNNNIRVAAQTYRQSGNDYFPGPLSIGSASVNATTCKKYDKVWSIKLSELDDFRKNQINWSNPSEDIESWPCEGDPANNEGKYLAPFYDANGDKKYHPQDGDYPSFDQDVNKNIPDQMMFILYNDKGNIHSESEAVPIGLEFQTHAFAYSTNDEVNNMTFYRTKITNRSTEKIDSCIFGQWVDADLGNYSDDFVECDVNRNLGICYNGQDNDPGILGYGLNPPSVGVNFFQGPKRPDGSEIGLSKFVYYNNDWSQQGNPQRAEHYWGYLNGRWKDGTPITYGGNGKSGSDTASYMFPGSTDPAHRPEWTEVTSGNTAGDRRFLQTAGPFTLLPGAVNTVTIGVVWARASSGGARGSFNLLKLASDKAYALFKNNFNIIAGPDAPVMQVVELDRQLLFNITNTETIENFTDSFAGPCATRTRYKFQGYQVFQLKTPNIPSDIYDQNQAKLVAQFDIVDGVARIVNSFFDPELSENVKKIMVTGSDKGIQHSFMVEKDLFATGTDQSLVNFKSYHFVIIAYASAVNCVTDALQYLPSRKTIGVDAITIYSNSPHDPSPRGAGTKINSQFGEGIALTQLEGIGNGGNTVMLSKESIEQALSSANNYKSPARTYITGGSPVYVKVIDPLKVPSADFSLWLRDTSTSTKKEDTLTSGKTNWYLKNNTTGEVMAATKSIASPYEQIFPQWGLSVNVAQCIKPGDATSEVDNSNGFISSSIDFADKQSKKWLVGVDDENANYGPYNVTPQLNWIRSGTNGKDLNPAYLLDKDHLNSDFADPVTKNPLDPRKDFAKMILNSTGGATWAPYALATRYRSSAVGIGSLGSFGPASDIGGPAANSDNLLSDLQSVQVFITADKSKWSRCIVLETGEDANQNIGGADKLDIRISPSVDKNGLKKGDPGYNAAEGDLVSTNGMGWFPGYAVNLETGERLNIMFGEDSSMPTENGQDMIWNPTSAVVTYKAGQGRPVFGGKHFIYVAGVKRFTLSNGIIKYTPTRYDEGRNYLALMSDISATTNCGGILSTPLAYPTRKRVFFSQMMYTSIPTTASGSMKPAYEGLIPCDVTITINIKKPFAMYRSGIEADTLLNGGLPYFKFSTKGYAAESDASYAKKALDLVSIVPNPYYAFSIYEDPGNALSTVVKITNLPKKCTINIYTMDGVLVRRISRDDDTKTYQDWDLKNDAKVPIVSGIYLIHIQATELGEERIIKWVGVLRPADYDSF